MLLVCATRDINFDVFNMTLYVIYLIYENTLFVSCSINGFHFWLLSFSLPGHEIYKWILFDLLNSFMYISPFAPGSAHFVHICSFEGRGHNQNEIQCVKVYKIIDNKSSIIVTKNIQAINTKQDVSYFPVLF